MKYLATILCVGIIGICQAQTTSRDVEIFERYENGELVEQRQSATENGVPIENFDFESEKRKIQLKSTEMEKSMKLKMQEMQTRMGEMQRSMDQKMQDFEKRSQEMQLKMDQRMKESVPSNPSTISPKSSDKEIEKSPSPDVHPNVGESTENLKFT